MKKILILGGTGYIGTNLALYLCNTYDVTVTGTEKTNEILSKIKNIKFLKLRLSNINLTNDIVDLYDIFIMLIPNTQPHSKAPTDKYDIEEIIKPTQILFELLAKKNKKIIFSSTGGAVYGNTNNKISEENDRCIPVNSYGKLKLQLENNLQVIQKSDGLNATILRISNPYGGNHKGYFKSGFINMVLHKLGKDSTINIWGDGSQIRDYIHILDLCEYIKRVVELDNFQILNIGTGTGYSLLDVVEKIFTVFEKHLNLSFENQYIERVPFNVLNVTKSQNTLNYYSRFDLINGLEFEKNTPNV